MPQHDLILDNGSGAAFRADANNALAALGSTMKGPNAPPAPIAGMVWLDDDTPSASIWTLKMYDGADWIEIGRLNVTTNIFAVAEGSFARVDIASAATTDIGASASPNVRITGTTGINSLGTAPAGTRRFVSFAAALNITYNATSLQTPGLANITTAAGDNMVALSLGSGNWIIESYTPAAGLPISATATGAALVAAADAAAARAAISVSDQWVQLASANITAVSQIDLTWTGGAYLLYKIYILGLRPSASTANELFLRVRRNGSFLAGASDYNNSHTWWGGTSGFTAVSSSNITAITADGVLDEPVFSEIDLMQAASTERIITQQKSRWTSNTPAHSRSIFTSNILAGSGWLDGARISFVGGATNFAAVGKIVVLGMKS